MAGQNLSLLVMQLLAYHLPMITQEQAMAILSMFLRYIRLFSCECIVEVINHEDELPQNLNSMVARLHFVSIISSFILQYFIMRKTIYMTRKMVSFFYVTRVYPNDTRRDT